MNDPANEAPRARLSSARRPVAGILLCVGLGAVAGIVGGDLVGRVAGSYFETNAWVDAPDDWVLRFTGLDPDAPSSLEPPGCPILPAG
jgi:hypothetical protein